MLVILSVKSVELRALEHTALTERRQTKATSAQNCNKCDDQRQHWCDTSIVKKKAVT